ncbi:dihydroorotase [Clostridium tetani]|uniref:Dihydroorotase n=1 Tax=Clostridium tetani TaxID=1513 RepID=A0ABY0EQR0_CLOTA|nr:dihydroorotase [Clostridium tetani]CDI50570.1 dihydroorotase [Clostridium tetani 12124569]KHO32662.1 dihydroorotase [Clostridium tetani]RXI39362.1 dihydroorotase [Clostridium tetani]RXI57395.1 dihydroorotase [Clostridium tetani]RXI66973.1 dihydroorotase [Clostridium tetani]
MDLLIKNSRVVDFSQDFIADVYIKDGIIHEIGRDLEKNCKTIDGIGKVLMPSFIDLHAHFREPGYTYKEDIESGSKAAVKGGYTYVNLMPNTNPVCSSMGTVNYVINKADEIGLIDVHQAVSITRDFDGETINHIDELDEKVKVISEDGKDVMNSKTMIKAMEKAKEKNILVMCHCEDHDVSAMDMRLAEDTMTWRNITLAKYTGCSVHISHVSTKKSMNYIIDAKRKGQNVTCEVTPHHIALEDDINYRVNPPLRKKEDRDFLIKAIREGLVDAIGTDHAPHSYEDKIKGAPGISGIETAFSVCYSYLVKEKEISLSKLSEIMSKNPAEIMNLNKGQIKIGFSGDLILVNLDKSYKVNSHSFLSKGKNTPFEGKKLYGQIEKTIKNGKIIYNLEKGGF